MKHFNTLLLSITAFLLFIAGCDSNDSNPPGLPQLSLSSTTVSLTPNEQTMVTVSISADGNIASVTAEATTGSVTVVNVTGVGSRTGTAEIQYTAPSQPDDGSITVTVRDQENQANSAQIQVLISEAPPTVVSGGEVTGVWEAGKTFIVQGDVIIPQGQSLTIEEGVTIIIEGDGSQGGSPEFTVFGSLYSFGTEEAPIFFTVPEELRTEANIFAGLWGGILATETAEELVLLYTHVEFAGAPAAADSPIVQSGELDEGEPRYGVFFANPQGKFVMMHSRIAYSKDDAFRPNGAQLLMAFNVFEFNGETGGEGINIKGGTVGDVAYNLFFSMGTNGPKWSNSGGRSPQTDVNVYNNTIINSGFRRAAAGRGGSVNVEGGARGLSYNNLIVNSRFGVRLVQEPNNADEANMRVGYSFYYGDTQSIVDEFYPSVGTLSPGDFETEFDIAGGVGENDPLFVNFDVTGFDPSAETDPSTAQFRDPSYDFRLQSNSPALNAGTTNFSPRLASITAGGRTFEAPAPSSFIGAFGSN
ncbi:MAG: hypothetical protein ACFCU6_05880 [Balneolaceae bacterium]